MTNKQIIQLKMQAILEHSKVKLSMSNNDNWKFIYLHNSDGTCERQLFTSKTFSGLLSLLEAFSSGIDAYRYFKQN